MELLEFAAEPRSSLGSGAARRFRRKGSVPAVLYGHGEPQPIMINSRAIEKAASSGAGRNLIFKIQIAGRGDEPAIIRDLQRHPLTRAISHVDFLRVLLDEKITTEVHIELVGASEAVKLGGILMTHLREIEIRALPLEIPQRIEADISVLNEIGDTIHVSDLKVPDNLEIITPGRITIATVQAPAVEEAPTPAEAVAAEGADAAAGAAAAPAEGAAPEKSKKE